MHNAERHVEGGRGSNLRHGSTSISKKPSSRRLQDHNEAPEEQVSHAHRHEQKYPAYDEGSHDFAHRSARDTISSHTNVAMQDSRSIGRERDLLAHFQQSPSDYIGGEDSGHSRTPRPQRLSLRPAGETRGHARVRYTRKRDSSHRRNIVQASGFESHLGVDGDAAMVDPRMYGGPINFFARQQGSNNQQRPEDIGQLKAFGKTLSLHPSYVDDEGMLNFYTQGGSIARPAPTYVPHDFASEPYPQNIDEPTPKSTAQQDTAAPSSSGIIYDLMPVVLNNDNYEYTLQVDPGTQIDDPHALVYTILNDDQKLLIMDRIRQIRPFCSDTIRRKMHDKLTGAMALRLLSSDPIAVDDAVEKFYGIKASRRGPKDEVWTPWMEGLTNAQRRAVIEILAEATSQATDRLREQFLSKRVTPEVAKGVLDQHTPEEVQAYARDHGLLFQRGVGHLPWNLGLSHLQRTALQQRLEGENIPKKKYSSLMERYVYPPGWGKAMLRARPGAFREVVDKLREKYPLLLLGDRRGKRVDTRGRGQ
ncbi:hypothetical protein CBS101457_000116 [Exobasidium rhododendri]|nr:hypothetical protein CBS101457_000116 [Exobasidium rhododendri]